MLNTSDWPEKKLNVLRGLHLDPRNVRLDIDPKVEADILEDLFINENALGLVEAICKVGYLTHDVPVAIKRDGEYVMVEGNRRLAALKAIQNPALVPTHQARIENLVKNLKNRASLSNIRVMVAPDQNAADQLVAAIHTSNLRRRWGAARQAAFFQAQVDSGKKLKTLVARYPTIDVKQFVRRALIVNEFRNAKLKDPALRDFFTTKQWKSGLSVLNRIYPSRDFQALTGFSMDDEGKLSKSISQAKFNKIAEIIIQGMKSGDLNTRSLNTVRSLRFTMLIDELRDVVEPRPQAGKGSKKTGEKAKGTKGKQTGDATQGKGDDGTSPARSRPGRKKRYLVELSQIDVPDSYPHATRECLQELSAIDMQRFPNAAFLLMRASLEKSIKAFAEAKGADIRGVGNEQGRVQLGHALKWLLQYAQKEGPPSIIQPIQRVRDGKLVYMASGDSLNAVNHNHEFSVDPDEALAMWGALDPLMRYVVKI